MSRPVVCQVGISRMAVSARSVMIIRTHALGSCAGIVMYCPEARAGGLVHAQLPLSRLNPEHAARNPCMFVDTGTAALLQALLALGATRERLLVKAAGCASLHLGTPIGEQNYAALLDVLRDSGLRLAAADVGGALPRTLSLSIADGAVGIESDGRRYSL